MRTTPRDWRHGPARDYSSQPNSSGVTFGGAPAWLTSAVSQNQARLALLGCGVLNALAFDANKAVAELGVVGAVTNTFSISAVVWVALFLSARFLIAEVDQKLGRNEWYIHLLALGVFLIPLKHISWAGLTLLAIGILQASRKGSPAAKGAWILMAATFPMFWSKLLFSLFSGIILQVDAALVSSILGMPRDGNTITLADGRTHLFIAAGCSSLANVSLVVLCWTMFCQLKARRISEDYLWCLAASCAIVAINVGRISLIGFFPQHYELLHGALGASLASWLIVIAMMGIFAFGMNRGGWQHD